MEGIIKKYQQKFRRIKDEIDRWDAIQVRFISQFREAASIIEKLPVLQDSSNYRVLNCISGIEEVVLGKQMLQIQTLMLSMKNTLEEFNGIVLLFEKIHRDGTQLVKVACNNPSQKQLQHKIGVKPCIADCVDGLAAIHDMHQSEFKLKMALLEGLSIVFTNPSPSFDDLKDLQRLLVDQPNIPKDEIQHIFDITLPEEIG